MGDEYVERVNQFTLYFLSTLFSCMAVLALAGLVITVKNVQLRNKSVLVLLCCILFYSVDYWVFNYLGIHNNSYPASSLVSGSEALCHWVITYTYLKVEFQTDKLLDPLVYFNDHN